MRKVALCVVAWVFLVVMSPQAGAWDWQFFYGDRIWNQYGSVPYAHGNISFFNGAGQASAIVRYGPNTVNAVPGNTMQMWFAGSNSSSWSGDRCEKLNLWFYQQNFAEVANWSTGDWARTERCHETGLQTRVVVLFNTNVTGRAWYVRLDGSPVEWWRGDMASVAVHETVHATGWHRHFDNSEFSYNECEVSTMCSVQPGGTTIKRTLEAHERTHIDSRYN